MADNDAGLARLKSVVGGLRPADLSVAMPAGWTVAAVLGHLAFWDLRAAEIVRRRRPRAWAPGPWRPHLANEAMRPLLLALPPEEAARLAVSVRGKGRRPRWPPRRTSCWPALGALGEDFWPRRCRHWHKHLDDVERALEAAGR